MVLDEQILNYLKANMPRYKEIWGITDLALFGSFATGSYDTESDIDLLIEFEPNTVNLSEKKNQLRKELQERFNRSVDLCRFKYIKPYFRTQILEQAIDV